MSVTRHDSQYLEYDFWIWEWDQYYHTHISNTFGIWYDNIVQVIRYRHWSQSITSSLGGLGTTVSCIQHENIPMTWQSTSTSDLRAWVRHPTSEIGRLERGFRWGSDGEVLVRRRSEGTLVHRLYTAKQPARLKWGYVESGYRKFQQWSLVRTVSGWLVRSWTTVG